MNWGFKIMVSYVLFAGFVITLVYKMVTSGNDLVKPKYFLTGTQVNHEMELRRASKKMENGLVISVLDSANHTLLFSFHYPSAQPIGMVELICLSADQADQKFPLHLEFKDGCWQQQVRLQSYKHGNWLCEVRGKTGAEDFLLKTNFKL